MRLKDRMRDIEGDLRELALSSAWFDRDSGDWREGTPSEVLAASETLFDMADDLDVAAGRLRA